MTISKTFTFITRVEVPPELDHLHKGNDLAFQKGTLHDAVASNLNHAFGGYSTKDKNLAGRVLTRAELWVDGLEPDHLNHNPADNTLANLEMVTHAENLRRRRRVFPLIHELMPQLEIGVRIYAFAITVKVDDINKDLLDKMIEKYKEGKLQYRALNAVVISGSASNSLAHKVLAADGIEVPPGMTIHHINLDRGLNLPTNMRVVTPTVNNQNKSNSAQPSV